jgi:hypothetical protein
MAQSENTVTWTTSNVPTTASLTLKLVNSGGSAVTGTTVTRTNNPKSYTFTLPSSATAGTYTYCISSILPAANDCSTAFTITAAPSIDTISLSPSASTVIILGSTLTIQWTYSGSISNIKINLLRNGVMDRTVVPSRTASTLSYQWNLPSTGLLVGTSVFSIQVQDASNSAITRTSSPRFSISAPPTLSVIVPLGTTQWLVGSASTVIWTSTGISGLVSIKLYRGSGTLIKTLSAGVSASAGSFTVTAGQTTDLVAGTNYVVQVRDTVTGSYADSSAQFQVVAAGSPAPAGTITVAIPTNNPCSAGGDACLLTWSYSFPNGGIPSKVKLTYSGASSGTITNEVNSNPSSYSWPILGNVPGGTYYIHVTSIGLTPIISSTSNSFSIVSGASITVTQPSVSTVWYSGQTVTVAWLGNQIGASGHLNNVNIELLKSGTSIQTLGTSVSSTASGGSKSDVVVPLNTEAGSSYTIRVTSTSNGVLYDDSEFFTVQDAPRITITSPIAESKWAKGSILSIRWNVMDVESIKIELINSQTNVLVQSIARPWITAPGNINQFNFQIPNKMNVGNYKIKLTSLTNSLIVGK